MLTRRFHDRREAGRLLASRLRAYAARTDVVVVALPRGGVPVGFEVARALEAPLDVLVVRKLGVPQRAELAMGAVAPGGVRVLYEPVVRQLGITEQTLERVTAAEREELVRRERAYRGDRPPLDVRGRTVLLVDDGLATGSTMAAAVAALRAQGPAALVVAVPVAAPAACDDMRETADACVCLLEPDPLYGVGMWYADFGQTSDEEVRELLRGAERPRGELPEAHPSTL